jgi:hypothetical protein
MNATPEATSSDRGRSGGLRRILLRVLLIEKVVQHAFVTWALAFDVADIREGLAVDYRALVVLGGIAGVLWLVAFVAHLRGDRRAAWLAVGLALFDIVGEFVAQGTLAILVTVSFVAAVAILALAARELRAQARATSRP